MGTFGNHGLMEEGNSSNESPTQKNEEVKIESEVVASENEEESEGEEEEEAEPTLRRSQRQVNPPKYLEDYVFMAEAEEEGEYLLMSLDNEPRDFSDASKSKEWIAASEDELRSIEKNGTWTLEDLPAGAKAIGLKWIFKLKRNSDGSINKHKARLVAKVYVQIHGIDFDEVFAPVARIETIRLLINLAAAHNWEIHTRCQDGVLAWGAKGDFLLYTARGVQSLWV